VATHWLPNIIKKFQKNYPNINYELLLGDYTEIEYWILEGRIDCGFLRLPLHPELETIFLEQDKLLVILAENLRWLIVNDSLLMRCAITRLCYWKKVQRLKYRKYSSGAIFHLKYILQHGMITQSCQWWKVDWVSVSCRSTKDAFCQGGNSKNNAHRDV